MEAPARRRVLPGRRINHPAEIVFGYNSVIGTRALILALFVTWFASAVSHAHPAVLTEAEAVVEPDGRFTFSMRFDTLAFALNDTSARIGNAQMEELVAGPRDALQAALTDAKGRFLHGFQVVTDRGPARIESIDFPDAAQVIAWKATMRTWLPVVLPIELTGRLPTGATSVAFRFPEVLSQVVLTVERLDEEPATEAVEAATLSTALPLRPAPLPKTPTPSVGVNLQPAKASDAHGRGWMVYALFGGIVLLALGWTAKRALRGARPRSRAIGASKTR